MTKIKKGGARTVLPIQYFDPSIPYYSTIDDNSMVFDSVDTYQQVQTINGCGIQPYNQPYNQLTGGSFQTIINPATNRKVSVHSRLGKKIITNYLQIFNAR